MSNSTFLAHMHLNVVLAVFKLGDEEEAGPCDKLLVKVILGHDLTSLQIMKNEAVGTLIQRNNQSSQTFESHCFSV